MVVRHLVAWSFMGLCESLHLYFHPLLFSNMFTVNGFIYFLNTAELNIWLYDFILTYQRLHKETWVSHILIYLSLYSVTIFSTGLTYQKNKIKL